MVKLYYIINHLYFNKNERENIKLLFAVGWRFCVWFNEQKIAPITVWKVPTSLSPNGQPLRIDLERPDEGPGLPKTRFSLLLIKCITILTFPSGFLPYIYQWNSDRFEFTFFLRHFDRYLFLYIVFRFVFLYSDHLLRNNNVCTLYTLSVTSDQWPDSLL